jgi:Adenosine deaminase
MAKSKGLRLKAHVREWGSADDVWRAVEELELDEVQHGIAAAGSSAVMRMLADNHIRLNVCPTSNVMLGRVDRLETHPIRRLYDAGVKVTVNMDDVLVFGNGVSEVPEPLPSQGLQCRRTRRSSPGRIERCGSVVRAAMSARGHFRWNELKLGPSGRSQ